MRNRLHEFAEYIERKTNQKLFKDKEICFDRVHSTRNKYIRNEQEKHFQWSEKNSWEKHLISVYVRIFQLNIILWDVVDFN